MLGLRANLMASWTSTAEGRNRCDTAKIVHFETPSTVTEPGNGASPTLATQKVTATLNIAATNKETPYRYRVAEWQQSLLN
jgi:hypothetical protein